MDGSNRSQRSAQCPLWGRSGHRPPRPSSFDKLRMRPTGRKFPHASPSTSAACLRVQLQISAPEVISRVGSSDRDAVEDDEDPAHITVRIANASWHPWRLGNAQRPWTLTFVRGAPWRDGHKQRMAEDTGLKLSSRKARSAYPGPSRSGSRLFAALRPG